MKYKSVIQTFDFAEHLALYVSHVACLISWTNRGFWLAANRANICAPVETSPRMFTRDIELNIAIK